MEGSTERYEQTTCKNKPKKEFISHEKQTAKVSIQDCHLSDIPFSAKK